MPFISPDDIHDYAVEQALAAAIIAKPHLLVHARTTGLNAGHFHDALIGRTWDRICRIIDDGRVPNVLTLHPATVVDPAFTTRGHMSMTAGQWLADLSLKVVNTLPDSVEDYANRLIERSSARAVVRAWQAGITRIVYDDPEVPTAQVVAETNIETRSMAPATRFTEDDFGPELVDAIRNPPERFATGLPTLDAVLGGGLFLRKLYGIGARKKAGKTMLLTTISYNLTLAAVPHLFITLEMNVMQILQRKVARFLNINPDAFLAVPPAPDLAHQTADYFAQSRQACMYLHAPGLSLESTLAEIASAAASGLRIVLIDYQQLIRGRHERQTQAEHQEYVAQDVANLCARLNICCVMAAQLNQDGNTRGGEGLRLAADLYLVLHRLPNRESGWLEMQDSRYVPHRNVGSEDAHGLYLRNGAWFSEEEAAF